jgi:hypothetical protein
MRNAGCAAERREGMIASGNGTPTEGDERDVTVSLARPRRPRKAGAPQSDRERVHGPAAPFEGEPGRATHG